MQYYKHANMIPYQTRKTWGAERCPGAEWLMGLSEDGDIQRNLALAPEWFRIVKTAGWLPAPRWRHPA